MLNITNNSWQPKSSIETLKLRAKFLQNVRDFYTSRGYWEVDTPIASKYGVTDEHLHSVVATINNVTHYLQTSPEYCMKRLLAAGSGSIFQIAKVFRDEEVGRWHNPEFTMLEWYRVGVDHMQLLEELDEFFQIFLQTPPFIKMTYQDAFLAACNFDPFKASKLELRQIVKHQNLDSVAIDFDTEPDAALFLLMSHVVEPYLATLNAPVAVLAFPVSQASLAKISNNRAERFEVYYKGIELVNGFYELTDAVEQSQRFAADNAKRIMQGKKPMSVDPLFLQALQHGLPECAGAALGLDRFFALMLKNKQIINIFD
jgi:lysyl-tRNA synthetase class 2